MQALWSRLTFLALRNHTNVTRWQFRSRYPDNSRNTFLPALSYFKRTLLSKKAYLPLELSQGFHWGQKGEWSKLTQVIQVLFSFLIIATLRQTNKKKSEGKENNGQRTLGRLDWQGRKS